MKMNSFVIYGLSLLAISGCVSAQKSIPTQPENQRIRVTDRKIQKECVFVGQVNGFAQNFYMSPTSDLQAIAINDLKNQAAELKGNVVQLELSSVTDRTYSIGGNAFKCP